MGFAEELKNIKHDVTLREGLMKHCRACEEITPHRNTIAGMYCLICRTGATNEYCTVCKEKKTHVDGKCVKCGVRHVREGV